jgi:Lrp/AsnC family transcriptional regulator, regulator for asnA, asnC and gidA
MIDYHMTKIDEVDLKLLKELQKDGRKSFREIAEKLDVAEGTVYNRVNKLREEGIIKNFIVDIDYGKLGYDLTTVIGVKVKGGHLPEIEEKIAKEKNVTAVYDITGEYDAIVVAKFPSRDELNKLVKKINAVDNVERTYTMVVLNILKEQHGIGLD